MMDVKVNFKLGQKDLLCRACRKADENQQHLLECERLSQSDLVTRISYQYQDLFKNDPGQLAKIGRILKKKYEALKQTTNVNTC